MRKKANINRKYFKDLGATQNKILFFCILYGFSKFILCFLLYILFLDLKYTIFYCKY